MNVDAIKEVRFDSGFRLFLLERRGLPVVASVLWYHVGARDELTSETGVSHFLEHMMFKGTHRMAKGTIDLLTSKMGGSNNAFTDNDETVYHFSMASDRWETALEIESDRMRGCLLDPAEFKAEKSVVLEELAMGEDDPWRSALHVAGTLAFQVHPYRLPVIGWKEDLERLSHAGMRAYYDRHYGPNRAFMVVVGDIDAARTEQRVRELFGSIAPSAQARATALTEPEQKGERRAVQRFPGNLSRLVVGVRTCRIGEDDDLALDLLSQILSGGRTSRLYRRLVHGDELATMAQAMNETRQDPGVFWLLVELKPGASREKAEAAVRDEIRTFIARGPTPAEMKRARTQIEAAQQFEQEAVMDVALKIARFESGVPGGYRTLANLAARYRAIDARKVREVAARYFASDRWNVVWSLPTEEAAVGPRGAAPSKRRVSNKRPAAKKTSRKKTGARLAQKASNKKASKKAAKRKALRA